jgi:hypothetical protein
MELDPAPERGLARAILAAYATLVYMIERDRAACLLSDAEARSMHDEERRESAALLSGVRTLARRRPPAIAAIPALAA